MSSRRKTKQQKPDPVAIPVAVAVPPVSNARNPRAWLTAGAVALLLAAYYALALGATWHKSLTFDEIAHITAGYSYWTTDNYRLQPENGNLPQRLAALPIAGRYRFDYLSTDSWLYSDVWGLGKRLFFQEGNPADSMLRQSRAVMALVGMLTGLVVFLWARQLFGARGGLVALTLFAFSPTTLAHGPLATSDMAATLFFTTSLWCLWLLLHEVTWLRLSLSVLAVSGLFLAKFSAPLIVLIVAPLVVVRLFNGAPLIVQLKGRRELRSRWQMLAAIGVLLVAHALVVWALVWAAYGFRYSALAGPGATEARLLDWQWAFPVLSPDASWAGWALAQAMSYRLLPEAFLFGLGDSLIFAGQRSAFLLGRYAAEGWPWFFPYALLVKTSLWEFAALLLAVAAVARAWRDKTTRLAAALYRTAPLWSLLVVYWVVTIASHLNIGHRHILPTYPIMFILAGAAASWISPFAQAPSRGARIARALTVVVLAGLAIDTAWAFPNYLAYFNPLIGARTNAYKHLVDSSLDWGQDLPALHDWLAGQQLADQSRTPAYLSYFGTADPDYYGIRARHLPFFFEQPLDEPARPLEPGVYCISATMFQGVYLTNAPGPWRKEYEDAYQARRAQVERIVASDVGRQGAPAVFRDVGRMLWSVKAQGVQDPNVPSEQRAQWAAELQRLQQSDAATQAKTFENEGRQFFSAYEQLRFARLCAYLHRREPDAEVNYSILIFRLTADDLDKALNGPM